MCLLLAAACCCLLLLAAACCCLLLLAACCCLLLEACATRFVTLLKLNSNFAVKKAAEFWLYIFKLQ